MLLSFLLLMIGLAPLAHACTEIYSGPAAPYDIYHHWPYCVIYYGEPLGVGPDGCDSRGSQVMTRGNYGEPHHMRYIDGWWYDYDTGVGFPARNACDPSAVSSGYYY